MRVLLVGRVREMLEKIKGDLSRQGIEVDGSTDMAGVSGRYDARNYDLLALGGGVDDALRERLKREFSERNPHIILLDVFAPVAPQQIDAALRGRHERRQVASKFDVAEGGAGHVVRVELIKGCRLKLELYEAQLRLEGRTLVDEQVPAGVFETTIDRAEFCRGLNIILVTLGGREYHTHRIVRE